MFSLNPSCRKLRLIFLILMETIQFRGSEQRSTSLLKLSPELRVCRAKTGAAKVTTTEPQWMLLSTEGLCLPKVHVLKS